MRAAIRRKQNSESSRRSRAHRRQEEEDILMKVRQGEGRIMELEQRVTQLQSALKDHRVGKKRGSSKSTSSMSGKATRKPAAQPGEFFQPNLPFFGDPF